MVSEEKDEVQANAWIAGALYKGRKMPFQASHADVTQVLPLSDLGHLQLCFGHVQ